MGPPENLLYGTRQENRPSRSLKTSTIVTTTSGLQTQEIRQRKARDWHGCVGTCWSQFRAISECTGGRRKDRYPGKSVGAMPCCVGMEQGSPRRRFSWT